MTIWKSRYKSVFIINSLYIVFCVSNVKEKKTLMIDKTDKYLFTEVFSKFELHIDNPKWLLLSNA
jgi:hypothetical protein